MTSPAAQADRPWGVGRSELAWSACDLLPTVLVVFDAELRCRYANPPALRWLGRTDAGQVLGRPGEELLEPEGWRAALPCVRAALEGQAQRSSHTFTDAAGEIRRAHTTYTPHLLDEQVVGVLVQLTDTTDDLVAEREQRRLAEEAAVLRERERVAAEATTLVSRPLFAASLEMSATLQGSTGTAQAHVKAAIRDIDTALAELRALVVGSVVPGSSASTAAPAPDARAELAASHVADVIATLDAQGRYEWVSPSALLVTGWGPADLLGRSLFELADPRDEPLLRARWAEQVTGNPLVGVEYRHRRSDGSYQWVETRMRPLRGPSGRVSGAVMSIRDIDERHQLQAQLADALETFELSFTAAPIGKALVGTDGSWLKVNPALCAIVGRPTAELLSSTFQDITHPDDLDADLDLVGEVLGGKRNGYEIEKRYVRPDGREVWVLLNVAAARHRDGTVRFFVVQVQDIGRRKADAEALQHRADHDPLTGLWNRRRFADALAACYSRGRRTSDRPMLLACDLDGFKAINDTHGHAAGDDHLQKVAAVLRDSVRAEDCCARLGGDEFAILLTDTDTDTAAEIAERITDRIAAMGRGGISIGAAAWHPEQDLDEWLGAADRAMYRVKAGVRR